MEGRWWEEDRPNQHTEVGRNIRNRALSLTALHRLETGTEFKDFYLILDFLEQTLIMSNVKEDLVCRRLSEQLSIPGMNRVKCS